MILLLLVLLALFVIFCWRRAKKMMNAENKNIKQVFSEFPAQMEVLKKQNEEKRALNKNKPKAVIVPPGYNTTSIQKNDSSIASRYKKLERLYNKGESTNELEHLENYLQTVTFNYFLYDEVNLDIPVKILCLAGKFISDLNTIDFLKKTPFKNILEENGDRYGDVLDDFKRYKKLTQQTVAFRKIIENKEDLESHKKQIDDFFLNNEKLLNDTLSLNTDADWKDFQKCNLAISDFLLALSFYNHGNESAFSLYLNNIRTQDDYKNLTEEKLVSLMDELKVKNQKISSVPQIISFRNYFVNLQDIRDVWLFDSYHKDWKEKTPLSELEKTNLIGVDSL